MILPLGGSPITGGRRGASVKTLKKLLKKAGLKTTGKKAALTRRVKKAHLKMAGGAKFAVGDLVDLKVSESNDMGTGWKVTRVNDDGTYIVVRGPEEGQFTATDDQLTATGSTQGGRRRRRGGMDCGDGMHEEGGQCVADQGGARRRRGTRSRKH